MQTTSTHTITSGALRVVALGAALLVYLASAADPASAAPQGGFLGRDSGGSVVEPRAATRTATRTAKPSPRRATPPRPRRPAPDAADDFYVVDEDAEASRPTADPIEITGPQTPGTIKDIVYVHMNDTSIMRVITSPGRLTQINVFGDIGDVAFSDFERFRFDHKQGMIFLSPGTDGAALVDWKSVRADLVIILKETKQQFHFELVVVPPTQKSHRVINVNAPPPLREPTADELRVREEEARKVEEARKAEQQRLVEEARRKRDAAIAQANAAPLGAKQRRGQFEVAVSKPIVIDGKTYVKYTVTNRTKNAMAVGVSIALKGGSAVQSEILLASPLVPPKQTVGGLAIYVDPPQTTGLPVVLVLTVAGEKPAEIDLQGGTAQ